MSERALQSFDLGGVHYWQSYAKCGRDGCEICAAGPGHGPYWYKRAPQAGGAPARVEYIGKSLPLPIFYIHAARLRKRPRMLERLAWLRMATGALEALLDDKPLTVEQMGAIDELGFSDCMSSPIQIASIEPDPGE